jgi:hypothetical protein
LVRQSVASQCRYSLDEDAVPLGDAVKLLELRTRDGDGADVLVAHDHRIAERRLRIHLHVGAADTCHLDLHQRGVI